MIMTIPAFKFPTDRFRRSAGLILMAALLTGLPQSILSAAPAATAANPAEQPPAKADTVAQSGTVLHNNDLIRITVFQEDDLLTEARISKTGYIIFPLLGSVRLAGKTIDQAAAEIRERLDKDYVIHPQVTVTVLEYAKQWVTVLGEVQKPGTIELPAEGNLDLLGAIALAGGYTKIAAPNRITVRRQVNGQDQVIKVNGKDLAKDTNVQIFYVQPGDTIMVGQSVF
jgi:protein involved in polysaccharide export with SLBB domain